MTMDDLECQNRGFYGFFGDFGLRDTFQEQILPKSIEVDVDKLHMIRTLAVIILIIR